MLLVRLWDLDSLADGHLNFQESYSVHTVIVQLYIVRATGMVIMATDFFPIGTT